MITINGKPSPDAEGLSLSAYLNHAGYQTAFLAVEKDGQIIPRAQYDTTILSDGNVIEIVQFVGGG